MVFADSIWVCVSFSRKFCVFLNIWKWHWKENEIIFYFFFIFIESTFLGVFYFFFTEQTVKFAWTEVVSQIDLKWIVEWPVKC